MWKNTSVARTNRCEQAVSEWQKDVVGRQKDGSDAFIDRAVSWRFNAQTAHHATLITAVASCLVQRMLLRLQPRATVYLLNWHFCSQQRKCSGNSRLVFNFFQFVRRASCPISYASKDMQLTRSFPVNMMSYIMTSSFVIRRVVFGLYLRCPQPCIHQQPCSICTFTNCLPFIMHQCLFN